MATINSTSKDTTRKETADVTFDNAELTKMMANNAIDAVNEAASDPAGHLSAWEGTDGDTVKITIFDELDRRVCDIVPGNGLYARVVTNDTDAV